MKAYDGRKPFLFFESPEETRAAPIPASSIASLLADHRIPVAILNACQSAMQEGSEASLAEHFIQARVQSRSASHFRSRSIAAVLAMPTAYAHLTNDGDPVIAVHAMRRALYDNAGRQAYFGEKLDLDDWVLPLPLISSPYSCVFVIWMTMSRAASIPGKLQ